MKNTRLFITFLLSMTLSHVYGEGGARVPQIKKHRQTRKANHAPEDDIGNPSPPPRTRVNSDADSDPLN